MYFEKILHKNYLLSNILANFAGIIKIININQWTGL